MKHSVSVPTTPTYLRDIRAFCLVVDLGSMTAAAKQLGETKGSISRRLSRIEQDLGVALLRRSTRQVQATEFGLAYRRIAYQALEMLDDASIAAQTSRSLPSGQLRVAASHGFGVCVLAPLVLQFVARYPEVNVEVFLSDEPPNFSLHQIDVAIEPARSLRDSSLIVRRLLDWGLQFVATADYLRQHGTPRLAEELSQHRLIFGGGRVRRTITAVPIRPSKNARARRITVQSAVASTNTAFVREAALAGGGIALLPDFLIGRDLDEGRLVEVLAQYKFQGTTGSMFLLYPAMRFIPAKVQVFRDFLIEALSPPRAIAV
jgi:DNA-binding transcriptional LysR family regulator